MVMQFHGKPLLLTVAALLVVGCLVRLGQNRSRLSMPLSQVQEFELMSFSQSMDLFIEKNGFADWIRMDEVLEDLEREGLFKPSKPLEAGLDRWGMPIVLLRDEVNRKWILRSFGPNRRDEWGDGDDIQIETRGHWRRGH